MMTQKELCIKPYGFLVEYVTTGPFGGPLSVDFTHVQKVRQRFSAICILIFKSKTSIKV